MQEQELLQQQRQNLRLFRQAAADRGQDEKALAENFTLEKAQADSIQNSAQSKADKLQEKAHNTYTTARDRLKPDGLDATLPLPVKVPAKPMSHRPDDDPEIELDHAVSLTISLFHQLSSSLDSYELWQDRRQLQKEILIFVAIVIGAIILAGGYLLFEAWGKVQQYKSANSALEAGEWEEARRLFTELGDYQDSQTLFYEAYYQPAKLALEAGEWEEARRLFSELEDYQDSQTLFNETYYQQAKMALEAGEWEEARRLFSELGDYQDSQTLFNETYYQQAKMALEAGEWEEARRLFIELGDYQDSQTLLEDANDQLAQKAAEAGEWRTAITLSDGSPQDLLHLACPPPPEPSLGDTWERCSDGMIMVYVPEGNFLMGSTSGRTHERPVHEVTLTGFWLDRTEVTNKMYEQCVATGTCRVVSSATDRKFNGENQPVAGVNWDSAYTYCEWVGGELPTEAQWEYSARGPDGSITYPWGDNLPSEDLANFGKNVGQTTDVGSYSAGGSWVGALDIAGNIAEWVADWYSKDYYAISPLDNPIGPESGRYKVYRGGSWESDWSSVSSAYRSGSAPSNSIGIGFRCIFVPGK